MIVGRFFLGVMALLLAGIFVRQQRRPTTQGTLPTDSLTFAVVIVGAAVLIVALTFLPALTLGPLVEQFRM
jgi:K+-transporting ATPase ATPase A chain